MPWNTNKTFLRGTNVAMYARNLTAVSIGPITLVNLTKEDVFCGVKWHTLTHMLGECPEKEDAHEIIFITFSGQHFRRNFFVWLLTIMKSYTILSLRIIRLILRCKLEVFLSDLFNCIILCDTWLNRTSPIDKMISCHKSANIDINNVCNVQYKCMRRCIF